MENNLLKLHHKVILIDSCCSPSSNLVDYDIIYVILNRGDFHLNLKERAQKLKIDIPAVFIALKRKDTPFTAKIFATITIVYALSPIDLIPDFIPVLGYLDDLIILPLLIALTIKLIPKEMFELYRIEAKGIWANGKPKKWYYAIPFVLVWIFVLIVIVKALI